jgi:hypothetical protein
MDDVKHIKTVYQTDTQVMQLLMTAAAKEESAMDAGNHILKKSLSSQSCWHFCRSIRKTTRQLTN